MNETCRLCLSVQMKSHLTSIFSEGERSERLRSRILDSCPVTLSKDDKLPKAICDECRRKVAVTYEFREQCRKSERTLRSRYFNRLPEKIVVQDRGIESEPLDRVDAEATPTAEREEEKEEEGNAGGESGREKVVESFSKFREKNATSKIEKRYLCDICSKTFLSKSGLRFHLKSHNGAKPYQCRHCGKGFVIPSYAKRHERIHGGEKRFVCHVCSAAFASSNGLKYHLRSHTGQADYRCKICGKSFYRRKYLKEHAYTHTGEKPFVCQTCGSCYGNSGSLFVHEKRCKIRTNSEQRRKRRRRR